MANDAPEIRTYGMLIPEGGWKQSPVPVSTPGVTRWIGFDGENRYFLTVGSEAWDLYLRTRPVGFRGRDVNVLPGPWQGETSVSVSPADVQTDETQEPVSEFVNDPSLGVVPVGEPTDQDAAGAAFKLPSRIAARLLPAGEVSRGTATAFGLLPWVFWGGLLWWIYRRQSK